MQHPPSSAPGLEPETEEADTLDSRFPRSGLQSFLSFPFFGFLFSVSRGFLKRYPHRHYTGLEDTNRCCAFAFFHFLGLGFLSCG